MSSKNPKPEVKRLKGLDSLFGEEPTPTQSLPTQAITLPEGQPRRYFDAKAIAELTESIKQHGILQPLLVRTLPDDKYELVAGERRYRAAMAAGLDEVPVVIRSLSDEDALALALIENLQRENLNPVEETEGILQLLALRLGTSKDEVGSLLYRMLNDSVRLTNNVISQPEAELVKEVFTNLGLMSWESFISNRLPLLKLPNDILEALRSGRIAYTKAKAISKIKDETERLTLLEEAIAQSLSLSQIRERLKQASSVPEGDHTLKSRMDMTYRRLLQAKFWDDSSKQKKLEKLLAQMEALLAEDSTTPPTA
ncbi:ParB/RepB/Spo0J family partition protein [Allocoleopsis sp.]|uniref:ParB/RepB/Spo0J family partition protein n=1 Tax=Allocoleopsis sp. TaxID=3088169 RepID=UPI002FD495ED